MFGQIVTGAEAWGRGVVEWGAATRLRSALLVALVAFAAFLPGHCSMPPTDRDEGRYVLATRQMVQSGDYIEPRNQENPRHKQPAGIYWLQAAAVHASGQGDAAPIGVYRIPSLLGAVGASVLAWWAFLPLVGAPAALLGGMLTGALLLLGVEARIAKTDAALLCMSMAALGVLVRAFLDPVATRASRLPWLFWGAIGVGSMIKGPLVLLAVGVGAAALCWPARGFRWLGALRPGPGALLALAIALPWYIAIAIRTEGAFFETALGWNAIGKVSDVHQGHGGPPGYYSALVWITFWPAAPLLALAIPWIWRERRRREVQALLCLVLPLWVVFELVATKLPHYVLPAYPALAALVALAAVQGGAAVQGRWRTLLAQGFWTLPLVLAVVGLGAFIWFEGGVPWLALLAFPLAIGAGVVAARVASRDIVAAVPLAVAAAVLTWAATYPTLARIGEFWPSPNMAAAVRLGAHCPDPLIASAAYHEPSFVFLTRVDALLTDGRGAADFLAQGGCRVAFVDAAPGRGGRPAEQVAFEARLAELGVRGERISVTIGRNMNGGHQRQMVLWRLQRA